MGAAWLWGGEDTVGTLTTGCWLVTKITGHSSVASRWDYSGVSTTLGQDASRKRPKTTSIETKRAGIIPVGEAPPSPAGMPPASDIFVHQQRLGGGRAAAHGVDPHRMVHHGPLLVGTAVR